VEARQVFGTISDLAQASSPIKMRRVKRGTHLLSSMLQSVGGSIEGIETLSLRSETLRMTSHRSHSPVRLTPFPKYEERAIALERCPNCHNEHLRKTPRRKGGPAMFRCGNCSYLTNIDLVNHVHHMLGHVAA
jgi:hypothetical protein